MASKYSTLPDIDDQPDVFETPDSGDVGPLTNTLGGQSSDEDDGNENVVRSRVSVKDASARFKDSIVETSGIDFTDRLTRRKKAMYRSYVRRPTALETNEYELLPKDLELQETSIQKLRRLKFEIQELNEEIEKKKESEKEEEEDNVSQADLLSQISFLQSDLTRLGKNLGETQVDETTSYGNRVDEAKRLIKQLEAYKSTALATVEKDENNNESDDTVLIEKNDKGDVLTYELYYTPETAKMHKESKVADIDERIAKLESLIGSSSGSGLDDLPSSLATSSLIGSVSKLEQQITILAQPRQLEIVARRVKVLISELDRLNELKSGRKDLSLNFGLSSTTSLPGTVGNGNNSSTTNLSNNENKEGQGLSSDTEEKVNQLFSSMEKIDPLLNLTPALLTRLKALQGLHTEASTFGRSVKTISEEQTRMTDELKNLATACELLQKSVKENEETVNSNINIIDSRMTDLVQRVGALSTAP